MTPYHKLYSLLVLVQAGLLAVAFLPRWIKAHLVARIQLSRRLQRFVVMHLGWPGMLALAWASPHSEPDICLPCEARQHENKFKHVEKTYAGAHVRCSRCGLAKEYFRTLPKCKGKRS